MFPLLCRAPVNISKAILEDMLSPNVHSQVLSSRSLVNAVQLLAEVSAFHIKVQDTRVIHQYWERTIGERCTWLAKDLVEHRAMCLCATKYIAV